MRRGFKRRAPRAVAEIRKFAQAVMGTSDVRIYQKLNAACWKKGVKAVPHRMRVRIARCAPYAASAARSLSQRAPAAVQRADRPPRESQSCLHQPRKAAPIIASPAIPTKSKRGAGSCLRTTSCSAMDMFFNSMSNAGNDRVSNLTSRTAQTTSVDVISPSYLPVTVRKSGHNPTSAICLHHH